MTWAIQFHAWRFHLRAYYKDETFNNYFGRKGEARY